MNILKINGQALEGIYVDAAISFNKPAKRVSTYSVPGRNGDLVIDEGTFDNVLITYPVFEKNTFPAEFDDIVNELASLEGYQRIECSNDPQHYRLGRFVVPQNPTAKRLNRDGYYQLSFDCKPQRWLLSGEEDTEVDANPQETYEGAIATFEATPLDVISDLKVAIEPVQSGSGDPSPTNIRPISGWNGANVYVTKENRVVSPTWIDGKYISADGSIENLSGYKYCDDYFEIEGDVDVYGSAVASQNLQVAFTIAFYDANKSFIERKSFATSQEWLQGKREGVVKSPINVKYFRTSLYDQATQVFISRGNIYPITWQTEAGTVYGGTLNVTTGVLTIDRAMVDLGTLPWTIRPNRASSQALEGVAKMVPTNIPANMIAEQYKCIAANGTLVFGTFAFFPNSGHDQLYFFYDGVNTPTGKLVYELATPLTYQLTPTEVDALLGINNIWGNTGDVSVTVTTPSNFINPGNFPSRPLLRVYGTGTVRINDVYITIAAHTQPYIDIDCELQECYYGAENMNEYVSFSGNDFPELEPGNNYMLLASGITKLIVTPRWWIL